MGRDMQQIEGKPAQYMETGHGKALAILKLLEGLASLVALIYFMGSSHAIMYSIQNMFSNTGSQFSWAVRSWMSTYSSLYVFIVFVMLLVAVLENFGAVFLRFKRKGAGLVRFCHLVHLFSFILAIVLLFAGVVQLIGSIKQYSSTGTVSAASVFNLFGNLYMGLYVVIVLLSFVLTVNYHRCIAKDMKQIRRELKDDCLYALPKFSGLTTEARWIYRLLAISVVLTIVQLVAYRANLFQPDSLVDGLMDELKPVMVLASAGSIASVVATLYLTIRFWLVSKCSQAFDEAHVSRPVIKAKEEIHE